MMMMGVNGWRFVLTVLVSVSVEQVRGHGRLIEPPGRSTAWRYGFNTPTNYNDNQLYCGGFTVQYSGGESQCGVCGDPYAGPRENEAGGKYATGTIVRTYEAGSVISIAAQITANHLGWFEYKICPNNDYTTAITQACLDQHPLELADGSGTRYYIEDHTGIYSADFRLPEWMTCTQCVIQWRYHTGNSWGTDPDGTSCLGCGNQEEFYGCADVAITSSSSEETSSESDENEDDDQDQEEEDDKQEMTTPTPTTTTSTTTTTTTTTTTAQDDGWEVIPDDNEAGETGNGGQQLCVSAGAFTGAAGMDDWCETNCAAGYCPTTHCMCYDADQADEDEDEDEGTQYGTQDNGGDGSCQSPGVYVGAGAYANVLGMDTWCQQNCPGNCPATHCSCVYPANDVIEKEYVCESYVAKAPYMGNTFLDQYCQTTCTLPGGTCPEQVCACQTYGQENPVVCRARDPALSQYVDVICASWCALGWCPDADCVCE